MKLYLRTFCTNEHWKPAAPIVVVEVDDVQLVRLRGLREHVKVLDVESILVRGHIDRWDVGFDEEGTPVEDPEDIGDELRTEIDRVEVNERGFLFSAYVDNCPDQLTTEQVNFEGTCDLAYYAVPPWERKET